LKKGKLNGRFWGIMTFLRWLQVVHHQNQNTGTMVAWLKSESCKNEPVYSANNYITDLGLQKSSAKILDKETTLIALVGATVFKTIVDP